LFDHLASFFGHFSYVAHPCAYLIHHEIGPLLRPHWNNSLVHNAEGYVCDDIEAKKGHSQVSSLKLGVTFFH